MRNRYLPPLLLIALGACAVLADDDAGTTPAQPKSHQAVEAMQTRDHAVAKALDTYDHAVAGADQKELIGLKAAMTSATRAGDLDEANAIKAQVSSVETEIQNVQAPQPASAVKIAGTSWKFCDGGTLSYHADGTITSDGWDGKTARWKMIVPNVFAQQEPGGDIVKITVSADGLACLWQYADGGKVRYSTRVADN